MVLERLRLAQYTAAFEDAGYDELDFLVGLDEARSYRMTQVTHSEPCLASCRRGLVAWRRPSG